MEGRKPGSKAADLMVAYLHHKAKGGSKPPGQADLVFGVPLFSGLLLVALVQVREALSTGVARCRRWEAVASEEPFEFAFLVGMSVLLCLILASAVVWIILGTWKRWRGGNAFRE